MILFDKNRSSETAATKTRRALLAFALFFSCLHSGNVSAAEVTTECPLTKPGHPEVGLKYGEPLPEGVRAGGGPTALETKNGLLYAEHVYSTEPLYNSFLSCEYQDRSEIKVPIPGGLLHCGMVIREISRVPPIKKEWLRVWCISRVP